MSTFEISNTKEQKPIKIRGKGKFGVIGKNYKGNKNLKRIIISRYVKQVSPYAFADCENLKEVIFDKNVKIEEIYSYAFYNCVGLKAIVFPSSLKYISDCAFKNCSSLEKISFTDNVEIVNMIDLTQKNNDTNLKKELIYNNLWYIGNNAFENCTKLKEVLIPNGVKYIYDKAFYNCKSLKNIIIPSSVDNLFSNAFGSCDNLEEVVLNEGLEELNLLAFNSCHKLKKVIIPSSVKRVSTDLRYDNDDSDIVDLASTEFYSREINTRFMYDINFHSDKSESELIDELCSKYPYIMNYYGNEKVKQLKKVKELIVDELIDELCSKYPYIKKELLDLVNIKFKIGKYADKNVDFEEQYSYFIQYCNNFLFPLNNPQMANSSSSAELGISNNHSRDNSVLSVSNKSVDEFVPWYFMEPQDLNNMQEYTKLINNSVPISFSQLVDDGESILLERLGITKDKFGYWYKGDVITELKVEEMKKSAMVKRGSKSS